MLGALAAPAGSRALQDPKNALWNKRAPDVYRVRIETSKGAVVLEVTRDLAPRGADRFFHLVESGFYNDSRFFRVIAGRFAQFGIPGRPAIAGIWRNQSFPDDPVRTVTADSTAAPSR